MASPGVAGGGKRVHPLPYGSDVNQSRTSLTLTCDIYFVFVFKCCHRMLI